MDRADHDYCRVLTARYLKAFTEAWMTGELGMMQFYQRRLERLSDWQRELCAADKDPRKT